MKKSILRVIFVGGILAFAWIVHFLSYRAGWSDGISLRGVITATEFGSHDYLDPGELARLKSLVENGNDAATYLVGRYYYLYKNERDVGLPLIRKAAMLGNADAKYFLEQSGHSEDPAASRNQ